MCTTCRSQHTDGNINQAVCSITVVGGNAHGGVVVANLKRTAASDIRPQQALMLVVWFMDGAPTQLHEDSGGRKARARR